eukprot:snap_masked-scaffold18_size714446-processed-gene-4.9 protein:Tk08480 transcript:snap_masked-scaffold18_size714446-processed-gene-4.9-mRNA-1 annotation:"hypothetical protein SINV_07959"
MLGQWGRRIVNAFQRWTALPRSRPMEVTADNFRTVWPEVERAIDEAAFVAIDGEFTGLHTGRAGGAWDTPAERYESVRESARQFLLVQFGLCTFHYDAERDVYSHRAYNFYVWPKPYARQAPDLRFMCQTSSIDFLSRQDFDFNKLFKRGIAYLKAEDEAQLKAGLVERQSLRQANGGDTPNASLIAVPANQEAFVSEVRSQIAAFAASKEPSLCLPRANPFQRRLIYQMGRADFPGLFFESVVVGRDRLIRVAREAAEHRAQRQSEREQAEFESLDQAVGFVKVIRKLSESRRPVVGHNMLLDLCHTLHQFVSPLPDDYADFKSLAHRTFPQLIDTKTMGSQFPFKDEISNTSLEELKNALQGRPFNLPEVKPATPATGYSLSTDKYHEAGYDAYVTGLCFIGMANHLGHLSQASDSQHPRTGLARVMPDSPLVRPYINKLFLMKINDIPYLNLGGEDIQPARDHVFHVTFPSTWKTSDLLDLFSPLGTVHIAWLDGTSAFVSLHNPHLASGVLRSLNASSVYHIMEYRQFKNFQQAPILTGITPILAQSKLSFPPISPNSSALDDRTPVSDQVTESQKKRSISPDTEPYKRSKSITEESPPAPPSTGKPKVSSAFEEPSDW